MRKLYKSLIIASIGLSTLSFARAQCVSTTAAGSFPNDPKYNSQNIAAPAAGTSSFYYDQTNLGTYATYVLPIDKSGSYVQYSFAATDCVSGGFTGTCNSQVNYIWDYMVITDELNNVIKAGYAPSIDNLHDLPANNYVGTKTIRVHHWKDSTCTTGIPTNDLVKFTITTTICNSRTAYPDADGDGFGWDNAGPGQQRLACPNLPKGFVFDHTDCDDTDKSINPNSKWSVDVDGDGFGDAKGTTIAGCVDPSEGLPKYVTNNLDCNDTKTKLNPNTVWYSDVDVDGFGNKSIKFKQCVAPAKAVLDSTDCNDASANDTHIFNWYPDADGDGYGKTGSTPAFTGCKNPNFRLESLVAPNDSDCNDNDPSINKGALEIVGNNVDENCDGGININNSLQFANSPQNNGIEIPFSSTLDLDTNYTIEAWIKPSRTDRGLIVLKGISDYSLSLYNGKLDFYSFNIGDFSSTLSINDNEWTHVAVSIGNQKVTFYINGIAEEIPTSLNASKSTANVKLGYDSNYGSFDGNLDEVRIWNTTRTALQIKNTMNKSLTGSSKTGLVAYYTFDQGNPNRDNTSITSLSDISGKGNDGLLSNFVLNGDSSNFVGGAPSFYIASSVVTGTDNESISNNLNIYPNPSNGTFTVSSTSELGNVAILNSLGIVIYQSIVSAKQLKIELPSKEAGIFFVKVGNKMTKLIKE